MEPKKIWANLAVQNLKTTQVFYESLGFKMNGKPSSDLVSFKFGENDFVIHFFLEQRLRESLEGNLVDSSRGNEMMFSLSAETKAEVNKWIETVENAGGKIHFDPRNDKKELYDENGFYVLVFSDPDGHKFNVLFSPNM